MANLRPVYVPGDGDVKGPASSSDNMLPLFSGTTGKLLKSSGTGVTPQGLALLDDNTSAEQRNTLGLNNVTNTSDANKPVSTAQQTALNLKANKGANSDITSITGLTTALSVAQGGTGVTTLELLKSALALDNVTNTSDANKPVSKAQQTALNLKANIASPSFTGNPLAPTPASTDSSTRIQTTAGSKAQLADVGWGTELPPFAEPDAMTVSEMKRYGSTTPGAPVVGQSGMTIHANYNAGTAAQLFLHMGQTLNSPAIFYRSKTDSAWGALKEVAFTDSPTFLGTPTAPTAPLNTDTAQLATMSALMSAFAARGLTSGVTISDADAVNSPGMYNLLTQTNGGSGGPPELSTVGYTILHVGASNSSFQLASPQTSVSSNKFRLWHRQRFGVAWSAWKEFADLDSPTFSGSPTAPTAATGNSSLQLATTQFVSNTKAVIDSSVNNKAGKGINSDITSITGLTTALSVAQGGTGVTSLAALKSALALNNVNNTADTAKPVSTAQQTALNLKANKGANSDITSITGLTTALSVAQGGTGVTTLALLKIELALNNVNNTTDANKPVSTAQQTALNLKANIASPTFTGTPSAPSAPKGTYSSRLATMFNLGDVENDLIAALNLKQDKLLYTPVQQGGGIGQATNKIFIGFGAGRLKATVDSKDLGNVVFDDNTATESVVGVAKIATADQVNAGRDDTSIVTPKKMKAAAYITEKITGENCRKGGFTSRGTVPYLQRSSDGVTFQLATRQSVIGIDQSWQDMTASRAKGVTYTNSTGRPIQIFINFDPDGGSSSVLSINGHDFKLNDNSSEFVSAIIPAGEKYSLSGWGTHATMKWLELR